MEWSCPWELTTPAGTIAFNTGSGDYYELDPGKCSGDMPSARVTIDPSPRTHGAIIHPGLFGEWPFVLAGRMVNGTGTAAARNTLDDNLNAALRSIIDADGTLEQTPSGGAARTVTVRLQVSLATSPWQSGFTFHKAFVFGLVSGDTDWT